MSMYEGDKFKDGSVQGNEYSSFTSNVISVHGRQGTRNLTLVGRSIRPVGNVQSNLEGSVKIELKAVLTSRSPNSADFPSSPMKSPEIDAANNKSFDRDSGKHSPQADNNKSPALLDLKNLKIGSGSLDINSKNNETPKAVSMDSQIDSTRKDFAVMEEKFKQTETNDISLDQNAVLREKLVGLLNEGLGGACTFRVGSKEFKVSKPLFASKSSVFKRLMLSDCDEAKNEVIEASDLCPEAVEQFISYIHLDGIVQLDKFVDDLLALANKYEIEELKEICSKHLNDQLSDRNILHVEHPLRKSQSISTVYK